MTARYRFRDRPRSMRPAADSGNLVVDVSTLGQHVASYSGRTHTVQVDLDGEIHIHKRKAAPTRDKTHTERLKEIAEQYRKHVWW